MNAPASRNRMVKPLLQQIWMDAMELTVTHSRRTQEKLCPPVPPCNDGTANLHDGPANLQDGHNVQGTCYVFHDENEAHAAGRRFSLRSLAHVFIPAAKTVLIA